MQNGWEEHRGFVTCPAKALQLTAWCECTAPHRSSAPASPVLLTRSFIHRRWLVAADRVLCSTLSSLLTLDASGSPAWLENPLKGLKL